MADVPNHQAAAKKPTHRSPNYPAFAISAALEKARKVYEREKRNSTTPEVIAGHLGYKNTNGPGGRAISCLRQFGLLEDAAGMPRLTDLAFRLLHLPAEDPERAALMRDAALRPGLYRMLHEDYPHVIPSDATLTSNLLKRGFNPDSTRLVIEGFKETMRDAGVYESVIDVVESQTSESSGETSAKDLSTPNIGDQATPARALSGKSYTYSFEGNGSAALNLVGSYTSEDLDDLEESIKTTLRTLRRSIRKEQSAL